MNWLSKCSIDANNSNKQENVVILKKIITKLYQRSRTVTHKYQTFCNYK